MSEKMKYEILSVIKNYEKRLNFAELKLLIQNISNITPASIEKNSLRNINSNSIFLIGKLDWDNKSQNDYPLLSCLSNFVNKTCTSQNAHAGLILKQAWQLFSICVFSTIDERLVQAASLIESCIRLACINYCTNGNILSCNKGLKLLFFQKIRETKSYGEKDNLDSIFEKLSLHCKNCSSFDLSQDVYPCYDVLHAILGKESLLRPFFISTKNRDVKSCYWVRGKKTWCLNDCDLKPFSLNNNLGFPKPLREEEFEKIKKTRDALAHGNFKMPNEEVESSNNIYNNGETIIQRVCDMLIIAYIFLYRLTFDMFLEKQTSSGTTILVGKELIKYSCGISIYLDSEIKNYPSKERIPETSS